MANNSFKVKNSLVFTPVDLATLPEPQSGDIACDINDNNKIKKYNATTSLWENLEGGVSSVNTKTGVVVLDKTDIGLSNVDNTSDLNKPISTATQTALNAKINTTSIGQPNGVAGLDGTGKVPSLQLPSYVDDVEEYVNFSSLPSIGESGKIYVTLNDNKCYRWSGSSYVEVSQGITDHTLLSNIGTNSHANIDTHIAGTSGVHGVTSSVVGTSDSQALTNKTIDADLNTVSNIDNGDIKAAAAIDRTKLANGTADHVLINNASGTMSSEATLAASRGGLGTSGAAFTGVVKANAGVFSASVIVNADISNSAGITRTKLASGDSNRILVNNAIGAMVDAAAITATRALISDASGIPTHSAVTATELAHLSGVTSAIQTQINGKANTTHTHVSTDITDFNEAVDDRISTTIVAGSNVNVTYNDTANTLTISAVTGSSGATTLDGLNDVSVPSPANGQALIYNSSTAQWEAQSLGSGGATNLDGLTDVTLTSPVTGQVLKYNSTQWVNSALTKSDVGLSNVDNTSDANKPISTATQSALNNKADLVHTHVSTDITDFNESVDDRVNSLLVAGTNVSLVYNDIANTLTVNSISSPSAQSLTTDVFNSTGSLIPKMSVVYINGVQGDKPKVVLAQANSEMTSSRTYGLVQTDIPNMGDGTVIEQGRLENLNTDVVEWNVGDVLWLSSTTAGGITNVRPSAPNHAVFIGYLIRKHVNVGVIQVSIQNGYEIEELHDVLIINKIDNQVIKYDSTSQLWKNETLTKDDVGLSNVDNTSDLNKPISTSTQTALNGKANSSHTHALSDLTQSSATTGQVATWNGSSWVAATPTSVVTDHTQLTNIGTNTHAQIDSHISVSSDVHGVGTGNSIVGTGTTQALTNKTIDASLNTISNINNASISTSAAIDRTKVANGAANRIVVNSSTGTLADAAAITSARALISDANGIPTHSSVTSTELGYVSGVTSSIQTQLNGKASTVHTHVSGEITDFNEAVDDRVNSLLVAGSNISLSYSDNSNTLTVASSAEANTASNLGSTGEGIFAQKIGADLQFKKVKAGTNVTITSDSESITIASSGGGGGGKHVRGFGIVGFATATVNAALPILIPSAVTIQSIKAYARTAPTGASLIFDINKNGVSIFNTSADRLSIASGVNTSTVGTFSTSLAANDVLELDIDQIGSTFAGSDLTIVIEVS